VSDRVAVRRLFRVVNGGTPTRDEANWNGDVLWATPADLAGVDGGSITDTARRLTRVGLESGSAAVPAGSLLVSTRAPIGYVAETMAGTAFNQGCRGLVPMIELDIRFFRYQLLARRADLMAFGQGSTFTELSSEGLAAFTVRCPPLSEQRELADFLDAKTARIDALIEKKRQQVLALRERLTVDVSTATWMSLLGAPLPDRGTRAGWKILRLRRCFSSMDYGIGEAVEQSGRYPVLGMGNVGEGRVVGEPMGYVSDVEPSLLLKPGDLLFNRTNSLALVGKVALFEGAEARTTFASYLVRLRTTDLAEAEYLRYALNTPEFLGFARSNALPSVGQANLNPTRYGSISIPLPPRDEQRRIRTELDRRRTTVEGVCSRLERQIDLLREHRQALITAAATGELDLAKAAA
jgi:type I restriction enzyme S subunit